MIFEVQNDGSWPHRWNSNGIPPYESETSATACGTTGRLPWSLCHSKMGDRIGPVFVYSFEVMKFDYPFSVASSNYPLNSKKLGLKRWLNTISMQIVAHHTTSLLKSDNQLLKHGRSTCRTGFGQHKWWLPVLTQIGVQVPPWHWTTTGGRELGTATWCSCDHLDPAQNRTDKF